MSERSSPISPLETALAKLKRREQSPWGRIQSRSNLWLARFERHPLVRRYGKIFHRSRGMTAIRSEPSLDLDSLFVFSLLIHLLLFFLLTRLSFTPPPIQKEAPVTVRLLDLGDPAPESKKETVRTQPRKSVRSQPKPTPAPTKAEELPTPAPAPKPVPVLPGPKVLAEMPRENVASIAPQPPENLIQLPTRQPESGQPSVATRIDALPGLPAEQGLPLPETLRRSENKPSVAPGSSTDRSVLSSPDFAPYLEMIKKRVQSVWKYPVGMSGSHRINILFVLDRGGKLVRAEVLDSTDPKLNSSAVEAMRTASPFPPVPDSLKDLAGWPLRMRFTIDFGVKAAR